MSAAYVVETSVLTKRFGERVAVDGVELREPHGEWRINSGYTLG